MSKQAIKRGKIEKKYLNHLLKFMDNHEKNPRVIEAEIRIKYKGSRFSSMTIYNWISGKSKPSIDTLDLITKYMVSCGYEIDI